ncbi:uncharacterized protein N7518_001126 [Penicillium psychrosexuale]|uniref:uncharacterized protein n=1 Tax=Penicillium psychrosexuale TaxID=1002107 RepID=UPI0025458176|nr:uncharacterized protein N7518_001126 [Penicillium psychrosexuale]KAJ5799058.1 hypothetical protein N7518_001126 [Penicillium psychrosexuale]
MASIGTSYYDDELTAASLHRMSKAYTIKYLWVLQYLLLVMANGTKSGDFRTFQEAASLASLLIEGIQYRKLPPYAPESDGGDVDLLRRWQKWIDFETTVRYVESSYFGQSVHI